MTIKEMIEKIEQINKLKEDLKLYNSSYIDITDRYGNNTKIYTMNDYNEYIKEYFDEVKEILDKKKWFYNKYEYYQLSDIFFIGEYDYIVEFEAKIREEGR